MKHINQLFTVLFAVTLFSCSQPLDDYQNKVWEGSILRNDDKKELSSISAEFNSDTLKVYANAIFGANRDTLLFKNFRKEDSVYSFIVSKHRNIELYISLAEQDGITYLALAGNDFYAILESVDKPVTETEAFLDYNNQKVPHQAYMYLDGAYEGTMEFENQAADLFLMSAGGISIKLVFKPNQTVRFYQKSLIGALFSDPSKPSYKTYSYVYGDGYIELQNFQGEARHMMVKDNGRKLIIESDEINVQLHKKY